ncbi:MAG: TIGR02680 family protein [Propionivibrio sp.]
MNANALPQPMLDRWQPLRLGLIDLYHYDSEEFWFRDGHLLLRGNNGTGKSKVLSLTLPFLFDAQVKPSRVEPDGDPGKKMAWNLLMGKYERRIGYVWAEFGRRGENSQARFVTLGCGLSAVAARSQVDPWYFVADDTRIGESLWLTSPQGAVLNRERLQEALGGHGQVFPNAENYRRAVDERLFRLGATRYAALMDTLIQLRQPQLSKRPDEANLSEALTEAQPPLPAELLGDVADALNQLEEYRQELESFEALAKAVGQFNLRYRVYAGINARREAGRLRAAQTEFDKGSQAVNEARATLALAEKEEGEQQRKQEKLAGDLRQARAVQDALRGDPAMDEAKRLDDAKHQAEQARKDADEAMQILKTATDRLEREVIAFQEYERRAGETRSALAESHAAASVCADTCGVGADFAQEAVIGDAEALSVLDNRAWQAVQQRLRESLARRRDQLGVVRRRLHEADDALDKRRQAQEQRDVRADEFEGAATRRLEADAGVERQGELLVEAWQAHFDRLVQLRPAQPEAVLEALAEWVAGMAGDNPARAALHAAQHAASERFAGRAAAIGLRKKELTEERESLSLERQRLEQGEDAAPPVPYFRAASARLDRPGAPLWQLLEFRETVAEAQRAGLEAALEASGLLDAWVTPDGRLLTADGTSPWHDTMLVARGHRAASAAEWLRPAEQTAVAAPVVLAMLESIACGEIEAVDAEAWISPDGRFRVGPLTGAWSKPAAVYIGFAARAAARTRRLSEITRRLDEIDTALGIIDKEKEKLERHRIRAAHEWNTAPNDEDLRAAHLAAAAHARAYEAAEAALRLADARLADAERNWTEARARLAEDAEDLRLPTERAALDAVDGALHGFNDALQRLFLAAQEVRHALPALAAQGGREAEARADEMRCKEQSADKRGRADAAQVRWQVLFDSIGSTVADILLRLENARQAVQKGEVEREGSHRITT